MARASYRRRNDGIVEIVRPSRFRGVGSGLRSAAAALLLLVASTAVVAAYLLVGPPVLLLVACAVFGGVLWRTGRSRRPVAKVRPVGVRRTAP